MYPRVSRDIEEDPLESKELGLEEWKSSTCHGKWVYNPKKLDTEEERDAMRHMQLSTKF